MGASERRSAIAIPARLPSATASTTSRPPFTQSPPAKYFGFDVCPVARSTTTRPLPLDPARLRKQLQQRRLPNRGDDLLAIEMKIRSRNRASTPSSRLQPARIRCDRIPVLVLESSPASRATETHTLLHRMLVLKGERRHVSLARRYRIATFSAPSRLAAFAASIAVFPAPITTTLSAIGRRSAVLYPR